MIKRRKIRIELVLLTTELLAWLSLAVLSLFGVVMLSSPGTSTTERCSPPTTSAICFSNVFSSSSGELILIVVSSDVFSPSSEFSLSSATEVIFWLMFEMDVFVSRHVLKCSKSVPKSHTIPVFCQFQKRMSYQS